MRAVKEPLLFLLAVFAIVFSYLIATGAFLFAVSSATQPILGKAKETISTKPMITKG